LLTIFLWGGSNVGVKFLVQSWPPILVGSTRFLFAGMLMFAMLRWTPWLGREEPLSRDTKRGLWLRGGLSLAAYIAFFNMALRYTATSHVVLYLAASPVWALMWEGKSGFTRSELLKRYLAAALALLGVVVLFLPVLKMADVKTLPGEVLGLIASVLWTVYGRQCRALGATLSGATISAHTMWRAGVLLLPLGLLEVGGHRIQWWEPKSLMVQIYCIIGGGVLAYAFWNHSLRHWKTSEVYLFNNLIPLSTMLWAHFCLAEPVTATFWYSMALIVSGVVIGQAKWQQLFGRLWVPAD